ncbi:hypothetical protein [Streptomyces calidiresistens]|nr:hypothetical protein [Streptomyces calidiresistens]
MVTLPRRRRCNGCVRAGLRVVELRGPAGRRVVLRGGFAAPDR